MHARERFQSDILMSRNAQTLLHNEEPCRAQTLQNAIFLESLTYDKLELQKDWYFFVLENDDDTRKPRVKINKFLFFLV